MWARGPDGIQSVVENIVFPWFSIFFGWEWDFQDNG